MVRWQIVETISLEQIYALRQKAGGDVLLRFSVVSIATIFLMTAAISAFICWQILASGIPLSEIMTRFLVYPDGPKAKGRPYILGILVCLICLVITVWMATCLFQWASRRGQAPLIVANSSVIFDGQAFRKEDISHFERRKCGPVGMFVALLKNGETVRMLDAGIFGAPVRVTSA